MVCVSRGYILHCGIGLPGESGMTDRRLPLRRRISFSSKDVSSLKASVGSMNLFRGSLSRDIVRPFDTQQLIDAIIERLDEHTSVIHRPVSKTYRQLLELCIPFSLTVHIENAVKSSQKTFNKLRNCSHLNRVSEYVLCAALSARLLNSSAVE